MAQQIIVTKDNYGIGLSCNFIDKNKNPIDLTDKVVEVVIVDANNETIDIKQAVIVDYTNAKASIVLEKIHTSTLGLYKTFWSVLDENQNITAQEDVYYYVKDKNNGSEGNVDSGFDVEDVFKNLEDRLEESEDSLKELEERTNYLNEQLDNIAININNESGSNDTEKIKNAILKARNKGNIVLIPSGVYNITNLNVDIDFPLKIYGSPNTILNVSGDMFNIKDGCSYFELETLNINNAERVINCDSVLGSIDLIRIDNVTFDNVYMLLDWSSTNRLSENKKLIINNCNSYNGRFHFVRCFANKFDYVLIENNKIEDSLGSGFIIGNDTIDENTSRKNVFARNNVFKNLSRLGQGSNKPLQCLSLFVDNVVVDGNKFEELDNDDRNECEAVYLKSTQTSITNNIFINSGRKDGFLCIKGRGIVNPASNHNSYNHVISGNKFICTRNDSLQRAFYTNAENIVVANNIFMGRYEIINYLIDSNKVNINNNLYDSVVCSSVFSCNSSSGYIDNPTNIEIKDNIINNISNNGSSYYIFSVRTNAVGDKYRICNNKITGLDNSSTSSRILNIVAGNLYDLFEYSNNVAIGNTFKYATLSSLKANVLIITNNVGFKTENSGVATITGGSKTLNVNHLLDYSPTGYGSDYTLHVLPMGVISGSIYVTNVTGSRFTINLENAPASDLQIMWSFKINEINHKLV